MLPHTLVALRRRAPDRLETLALAMGADPVVVAAGLAERAGATHLRDLGVTETALDECAAAAAQRPDLAGTPPAADEAELRALYAAAF
jgi:alcohol dehydrogenase class IV